MFAKVAEKYQSRVEDGFETLGRTVVRFPCRMISAVFIFTLLCCCGFLNFRVLSDGEDLWIPQTSEAQIDNAYVKKHYNDQFSTVSCLVKADNILSLDTFDIFWDLHQEVTNVKVDGKYWKDICKRRDFNGNCMVYGPLQFWSSNKTQYDLDVNSLSDLQNYVSAHEFPDGTDVNRDIIFGKYSINETDDTFFAAKGMVQYYEIEGSTSLRLNWQKKVLDVLGKYKFLGEGDMYFLADRSLDDELGRSVGGDVVLVSVTYIVMICFTCVVLSKKCDCLHSRIGLSCCGIFFVLMGVAAGYGLSSGLGIPFIVLHQILPFIVVGVGVDDIFVLVNTFDSQNPNQCSEDRMGFAMRKCGISVLYTTATDVAAFFLGAASSLPAIRAFCIYAAFTLMFNFIFQMTAFAALLHWDTLRRENGYMDVFFCILYPKTSRTTHVAMETNAEEGEVADEQTEVTGAVSSKTKNEPVGVSKGFTLERFMQEFYGPFITQLHVRILVVLAFLVLLSTCVWGVTNITQGFDLIDLVPDDSYARQYILEARELKVFGYENTVPASIYFKGVDYPTEDVQMKILQVGEEFVNGDYNEGPLISWMVDFTKWVNSSSSPYQNFTNDNGFLTNSSHFLPAVEAFLAIDEFSSYSDDVRFSYDSNNSVIGIKTSRITVFHVDQKDPYRQIRTMEDSRDLAKSVQVSPSAFAFSINYLFVETEALITFEMTLNLILALVAVALVSAVVLIRPLAVLVICVLLVMVDVDIVGTMYFWDLTVNTVTVVQLVMAVGLVVDYMSHILHCYLTQPYSESPESRVKLTLSEIGPSIVMGCSTTFLGIMPLAFANSSIFRIFFRMFFCIIVYGAGHGLILLPAILPWLPFNEVVSSREEYQIASVQKKNSLNESSSDSEAIPKAIEITVVRKGANV